MAKGSRTKRSKKAKAGAAARDRGARRLEKALAAGLRREAKAASRLQAAQLEVAVLRMALAEVVGEVRVEAGPAAVVEAVVPPGPKKTAARPRAPRAPAAVAAPKAPAARPRRTTRPAPSDR